MGERCGGSLRVPDPDMPVHVPLPFADVRAQFAHELRFLSAFPSNMTGQTSALRVLSSTFVAFPGFL